MWFWTTKLFLGYAVITIEFPLEKEKYLGWAEAATGIGLVMGPFIGSILFRFLKYRYTFIVFGGLIGIGGIVLKFLLPNTINK